MARRSAADDLKDEFRYAVSDIRAAWERAWFGHEVTPSHWQEGLAAGRAGGTASPEPQPELRATVHSTNPDVPEALDGIGRTGGDTSHPDHTRDAVRTFYGTASQQDWNAACRGVFGEETLQPAGEDEDLAPERGPRPRR